MTSQTRTLVLFGSGSGIGVSVGANFAAHGFDHIILLARNKERLESDKKTVASKAKSEARVDTISVDLANQTSIKSALQQIDSLAAHIDVVFFNAARVGPSPLLEFSVEGIESDFRVS